MEAALAEYHLERCTEQVKQCYNGYIFGRNTVAYNPWSSVKFLKDFVTDNVRYPQAYWANSSGNDIVRSLIDRAGDEERQQIETLIAGGTIKKTIHLDITSEEIDNDIENLWNFLFFTGYLTKTEDKDEEKGFNPLVELKIPDLEVKTIYQNKIEQWFREKQKKARYPAFYEALLAGDTAAMTTELNKVLADSISFMDQAENFYHGLTLGVLRGISEEYFVKSNRESGNGRGDIFIYSKYDTKYAAILELKAAPSPASLEKYCGLALMQIKEKDYDAELRAMLFTEIKHYGIAFTGKKCLVKGE
jgi:hypothetical protein